MMDAGLLRQRRNLILISIALLLVDFADVEIARVSLLGTTLVVGRPDVLHTFAWVAWTYFTVRYLQYLVYVGDLGFSSSFWSVADRHLERKIRTLVEAQVPKRQFTNFGPRHLVKNGCFRWEQPLSVYDPAVGSVEKIGSISLPTLTMFGAWLRGCIHVAFSTPKVTDYVLPLALALAAPAVALYK